MIEKDKFHIFNYIKKEEYCASMDGMRYMLKKHKKKVQEEGKEEEKEVVLVTIWPEPFCFEKTPDEKKTVKEFVYTEDGLDEAYDWLCQIYDERIDEWTDARDNPYKGLF